MPRLPLHCTASVFFFNCNRNTCRWPYQPYQVYDNNTERVALQRRLPEDDAWCVPHNLSVLMFSPSCVNVICFDPQRGADQARSYAGKYASKPERWYYLEAEKSGLQHWLKCRTIGICQAWNRIIGFKSVRSTRSVQWTPCDFCPNLVYANKRDEFHRARHPDYPDPERLLSYTQKYFFRRLRLAPLKSLCALPPGVRRSIKKIRHPGLRHLRVEQFTRLLPGRNTSGVSPKRQIFFRAIPSGNAVRLPLWPGGGGGALRPRYLCFTGSYDEESVEDTRVDEEEDGCLVVDDKAHRHHDPLMAAVAPWNPLHFRKDHPIGKAPTANSARRNPITVHRAHRCDAREPLPVPAAAWPCVVLPFRASG